MGRPHDDLADARQAVRICEIQVAAQRDVVSELRMKAADTAEATRLLVVKELELALLRLRLGEINDDVFKE